MAKPEKVRKKRLAKQSKDAKAGRKPSTKKAQDASREEAAATRSTDDTNINKMIELGLPIPDATRPIADAKPRKKREAPSPLKFDEEEPAKPKLTVFPDDPGVRGAFQEVQKERDLDEIGKLGKEATPSQLEARAAKRKKYSEEIADMPSPSTIPKEQPVTEDALRPKMKEVIPTPTPAQSAARDARTAAGGSGTGIYTFDSPRPAEAPKRDVAVLQSRRSAKGLPGLPGDENGVNGLALGLAKRDYAIAKTTNKTVNEMDPEGDEPSHIDQIYFGHHRRLAEVMLKGGLTEDHIVKSAPGSGRTYTTKVKYLHSLLKKHESARDAQPINLEREGITHWIHPTTGVAHAIADNHPDMPTMQPQQSQGGDKVGHGFWRGGKEERVRKDADTGSYVVDKNTGNADVDSTLGWNPDKEVGYYTVNLRGGIKALKQNVPPASGRSLWEHEVNNMKNEFPASVSGDSRLQHKAYANRILQDASKSEVDGRVLARNRAGEPVPKVNRKTGKLAGMIVGSGRSVQLGYTVDENGEATQTTGTATSRARTAREGAPFPTKELGSSGYSEGGSTRVDRTTEQPERTKIGEFENKKRRSKKSSVVNGRAVVVPPQRGLLVQKRESAFIPKTATSTPSQQFAALAPNTSSFGRDPYILGAEPAEPITQGKVTYTKNVTPNPEAVKKNPKSKKTITKFERKEGMVDQVLPGFENHGVSSKFQVVEGPITRVQSVNEERNLQPKGANTAESKILKGKVYNTPIAASTPRVSNQLAKVAGNAPVDQPVDEGPAKTVRSYRKNRMEAPVAAPAAPAIPKEQSEQLALPGMEPTDSAHASGQQWLRTKNLSDTTRRLQDKNRTSGVPGGANPITVTRGTEAPKSNRSFK